MYYILSVDGLNWWELSIILGEPWAEAPPWGEGLPFCRPGRRGREDGGHCAGWWVNHGDISVFSTVWLLEMLNSALSLHKVLSWLNWTKKCNTIFRGIKCIDSCSYANRNVNVRSIHLKPIIFPPVLFQIMPILLECSTTQSSLLVPSSPRPPTLASCWLQQGNSRATYRKVVTSHHSKTMHIIVFLIISFYSTRCRQARWTAFGLP